MQTQVSRYLYGRISNYFTSSFGSEHNVEKGLSPFLTAVSAFYERLCYDPKPGSYGGVNEQQVADALLECLPKFLAAIYYLEYCVNPTFKTLGGGWWEKNWTGWEEDRWHVFSYPKYGGDLQKYLRAQTGGEYGGLIPGGFGENEVKYNPNVLHRGYPQGYAMVDDLQAILRKAPYNFLRSVFVSSTMGGSAKPKERTANALSLVRTFCHIVAAEAKQNREGGELIQKLNKDLQKVMSLNSICWKDLQSHCAQLEQQFSRLFAEKRFDFTGQSTGLKDLQTEELAVKAADWLRTNLINVRGNLQHIEKSAKKDLGDYFTRNLFPYGFTFDGRKRFEISKKEAQRLPTELSDVITELQKPRDGGLDRLKDILHGDGEKTCQEPPPEKKSAGTPNQGKKADVTPTPLPPNQNNDQSGGHSPDSPHGRSVPPPPSDVTGGQGPQGPTGPGDPVLSPDQVLTNPQVVQPQQPATQLPPGPPPPPPVPPGPAAAPGHPGTPGVTGQGSPADTSRSSQPTAPQVTVLTQPTSVSGSSSGSAGDQGSGQSGGGSAAKGGGQQDTQTTSSVPTTSAGTAPGAGGSGGTQTQATSNNLNNCSDGYTSGKGLSGNDICFRNYTMPAPNRSFDDIWQPPLKHERDEHFKSKSQNNSRINAHTLPTQPSHPAFGPSHHPSGARGFNQRPYYNPQERGAGEVGTNMMAMPPYEVKGSPVNHHRSVVPLSNDVITKFSISGQAMPDHSNDILDVVVEQKREEAHRQLLEKQRSEAQQRDEIKRKLNIIASDVNESQKKLKDAAEKEAALKKKLDAKYKDAVEHLRRDTAQREKDSEALDKKLRRLVEQKKQEEENERKLQATLKANHPLVKASDYYYHYRPHYYNIPPSFAVDDGGGVTLDGAAQEDTSRAIQAVNEKLRNEQDRWDRHYAQQDKRNTESRRRANDEKTRFLQDHITMMKDMETKKRLEGEKMYRDEINQRAQKTIVGNPILSDDAFSLPLVQHIDPPLPPTPDTTGHSISDPNRNQRLPPITDRSMLTGVPPPVPPAELEITKILTPKNTATTEMTFYTPDIIIQPKPPTISPPFIEIGPFGSEVADPKVDPSKMSPELKPELPPEALDFGIFIPPVAGADDNPDVKLLPFQELVQLGKPVPHRELLMPENENEFDAFDFTVSATDGLAKEGITPTCRNPWYVAPSATDPTSPTLSPPRTTDHLPPPTTVREMLHWMVGMNQKGYIPFIEEHLKDLLREYSKDVSQSPDAIYVTGKPYTLDASHVSNTLTQACLYAATVLHKMKYKDSKDAPTTLNFTSEYSKLCYSDDPARLLCQLREYVYACYHQLAFLKSQCSRDNSQGGWQDYHYGQTIKVPSPLQAFLTDAPDSSFKTHPFDPSDICLTSRVRMGFTMEHLPESQQTGNVLLIILSPACGGADPLLTLCSYLNCLTRRTPRTAGELVTFFHNIGNSLHNAPSKVSPLGSALSKSHDDCPDWDRLAADDLHVIKVFRGSATLNSNANHDKNHPNTLSTLLGCDIDNVNCQQLLKPITYRAYTLYSPSFVHHYLSWTVYLPDRLHESLEKLLYDLENLQCSMLKSLHQCTKAMPLLYLHGITPPDRTLQSPLTCSGFITKLREVINGKPIVSLMNAMDNFFYGIRLPFLYTLFTLWSIATLYIAHTMLYRLDILRIRSHLMRSKASHLIDVKALLAGSRRMPSLYKDDYFDKKAKEAYEKLDVHAELSKNVEKIVDANKAINEVHNKLGDVHTKLGEWNAEAKKVLDGAIKNAQSVHDALVIDSGSGQLKREIDQISSSNEAINEANKTLASEVDNLGKWNAAAREVIHKANEKCEEILKKVKTDKGSPGPIYENAKTLNEKAQTLLKAAKSAKEAVESKVGEALKAVAAMDTDLKKDLRNVKENIKKGITKVIEELKVKELDAKVQSDLGELRSKISGLKTEVDKSNGESLVKEELSKLAAEKIKLYNLAGSDKGKIQQETAGLETKFRDNIQSPLNDRVKAVDTAIEKLGGKFNKDDKKLVTIFDHIKQKVGEIKGKGGTPKTGKPWEIEGATGLAGIAQGVEHYFTFFQGKFGDAVGGWIDDILQHNGVVKRLLGWESKLADTLKEDLKNSGLGGLIKSPINDKIEQAADDAAFSDVDVNAGMKDKIEKVKNVCELFAQHLEQNLKEELKTGVLALALKAKKTMVDEVPERSSEKSHLKSIIASAECKCGSCTSKNPDYCMKCTDAKCILTQAIATTLLVVSSVSRQVGKELHSVLLGEGTATINIAQLLDDAKKTTDELHDQLTAATEKSRSPPSLQGQNESPAQAVDSKLTAVRTEVEGLEENFKKVKQNLEAEVAKLPSAVETFNTKAQAQIKEAAKTAIEQAVVEIEMDVDGKVKLDEHGQMSNFEKAHKKIRDQLDSDLKQKVDEHIGKDDTAGGGTETKVDLNISTGFTKYNVYVNHKKMKNLQAGESLQGVKEEGHLPLAIGSIKTLGLKALNEGEADTIIKNGDKTFTVPFGEITKQLGEIKELVSDNGSDDSEKGVMKLLEKLQDALNTGKLEGAEKGLEENNNAINALQTGDFKSQPEAIDGAVQAIKLQLGELREKLKNKSGKPEDDVIERLEDMKLQGLGDKDWTPNGKEVSGLGKIEDDLSTEIKKLPEETRKITNAIVNIQWTLATVKIKLDHVLIADDVMDNLRKLKMKIGEGDAKNAQQIHNYISTLQKDQFTNKPEEIRKANEAIKQELTALQKELQGNQPGDDVIATLEDLQNVGLSGQEWNHGENKKGFAKINGELQHQQNTLSTQPTDIQTGIQDITGEPDSLRQQLNDGVTDKLTELKSKGLTDKDWKKENKYRRAWKFHKEHHHHPSLHQELHEGKTSPRRRACQGPSTRCRSRCSLWNSHRTPRMFGDHRRDLLKDFCIPHLPQ
ncbi:ribosome binding protein [Babesia ovata]|uniref:Ribosome binding protein n=1 Tax=Babesia ovata TaxID=189622 RepID=A0A2H6K6J6_9APIC|nr:ribosome binding protein [Babesia ovata]GBE58609.1 ribosome binding protein [Babesia ovata]